MRCGPTPDTSLVDAAPTKARVNEGMTLLQDLEPDASRTDVILQMCLHSVKTIIYSDE